jgi:hypothetical protein
MGKSKDESCLQKEEVKRWVKGELSGVELEDVRSDRRLSCMLASMIERPGKSIPQCSEDWAGTKAFYRMLDNPGVCWEAILSSHSEATLRRAKHSEEELLSWEDFWEEKVMVILERKFSGEALRD